MVYMPLRERKLRQLIQEQERTLRDIERQLNSAKKVAANFSTLLAAWEDPVVLVRGYGWYVGVYHSAENPCGRVQHRDYFTEMLLSEARSDALKPCSACGHFADRAARPISKTA